MNPGHVRRLALVRLDGMEEFLLWLPTARHYRRFFGHAEIVLIAGKAVAQLADQPDLWDRVVLVEDTDGRNPTAFASMHGPEFDLIVNLQYSRTLIVDQFIATVPAKHRVAVDTEPPNMTAVGLAVMNELYTELLRIDPTPQHGLIRNFQILDAVTGTVTAPALPSIRSLVTAAPFDLPSRYVAIYPGSTWFKRAYPWPRFVAICRMLKSRLGLTSVICGGASDRTIADNIVANAGGAALNLTDRLNLRQSLGVIAGAQLLLANDSMAAHAANLLGVRSICIMGSGYNRSSGPGGKAVGHFFPYPTELLPTELQTLLRYPMPCEGCSYRCRYEDLVRECIPCVDYIPLSTVMDAVSRALETDFVRVGDRESEADLLPHLSD